MKNLFENANAFGEKGKLIQKVLDQVRPFFKAPKKSCYYPSTGWPLKSVFSLDADVFFFSDRG